MAVAGKGSAHRNHIKYKKGVVMKNTIKGLAKQINEKLTLIGMSPLSSILIILVLLIPTFVSDEYALRMVVNCLFFATLAVGFDLSAGYIGVANWGYGALVGVGAYTSALLLMKLGVTPWIGIFIGALASGLLGMLIGVLTLRMQGMFAAILAWFVGLVLMALCTALAGLTQGASGLNVNLFFKTGWCRPYFYVIFVIFVLTFIAVKMITRSNLGLAFRAIGQDEEAARTSGVSPMKYKVINFTVSCLIAGLAGGFYAHFQGILTPDLMSTQHTLQILILAFVGGRGSIWGPVLAAFILTPIFTYLNFLMDYQFVIYGLLLILVMIFYPTGIAGMLTSLNNFIKRKTSGLFPGQTGSPASYSTSDAQ